MKWPATKQDTARHSRVCWRDTSVRHTYKDERKLRLALSFFVGRPGLAKTSKVVFLGGCFVYRPPICTGICLSFVRTDIPQKKQSVKPLKFQRYNLYSFLVLHRPPLPPDRKSPCNNENSRETCSPYTKQRSYMAVWVFLLASRRRAAKRV